MRPVFNTALYVKRGLRRLLLVRLLIAVVFLILIVILTVALVRVIVDLPKAPAVELAVGLPLRVSDRP